MDDWTTRRNQNDVERLRMHLPFAYRDDQLVTAVKSGDQ